MGSSPAIMRTIMSSWEKNRLLCSTFEVSHVGMDQYLLIPFLVGWTSIYQLFWCSPGVQGFDTLPCIPSSKADIVSGAKCCERRAAAFLCGLAGLEGFVEPGFQQGNIVISGSNVSGWWFQLLLRYILWSILWDLYSFRGWFPYFLIIQ